VNNNYVSKEDRIPSIANINSINTTRTNNYDSNIYGKNNNNYNHNQNINHTNGQNMNNRAVPSPPLHVQTQLINYDY
jgi:hypothetical protein